MIGTAHAQAHRIRHLLLAAGLAFATIAAVGALSLITLHGTSTAVRHLPPEALEIIIADGSF